MAKNNWSFREASQNLEDKKNQLSESEFYKLIRDSEEDAVATLSDAELDNDDQNAIALAKSLGLKTFNGGDLNG